MDDRNFNALSKVLFAVSVLLFVLYQVFITNSANAETPKYSDLKISLIK